MLTKTRNPWDMSDRRQYSFFPWYVAIIPARAKNKLKNQAHAQKGAIFMEDPVPEDALTIAGGLNIEALVLHQREQSARGTASASTLKREPPQKEGFL